MKSVIQATLSTLAALAATQAEAKSIHNSCLVMSDAVAGVEQGEFMTNEAQLTSKSVSDDMRLHSITTCHTDGRVTGLQFHMALDPNEAVDEELYDMAPIGLMSGQCDSLEIPEGLDKIKATMNTGNSTVSLVYKHFDTDLKRTYGDQNDGKTVWNFTDENPLIGLYGRQTESGIAQLGFITLNQACQLAHIEPEPVEPVVEPVEPVVEPTEPVVEPVEPVVEPVEPTEPIVEPSEPVEPVVEPVEPVVEPVEPIVEPTEPVVEPVEPIVEPTEPVIEPIVEPIVEPVEPVVEPTDTTDPEPETQEEGLIFGLSLLSVILIVGGVLLLAVLATISICTVVRHKGQPQSAATSPTSPPKARLTKRAAKAKELVPVQPETDIENNPHPAIGVEDSSTKNINNNKTDF